MKLIMEKAANFIEQFRRIGCCVLIDDLSEPNRAVLVAAARGMSSCLMNRLITLSMGLPCVAISPARAQAFMLDEMSRPTSLPPSVPQAASPIKYCLSVEAREGVSTGISAHDRAVTVSILGEENPSPRQLVKPGHVFPVEVSDGGVLMKPALPEAATDVTQMVGAGDAAFFSDLLNSAGEFCSLEEALSLCKSEQLPYLRLSELIELRLDQECLIERIAEARLPTESAGELRSIVYRSRLHGGEHLALVKGEINSELPVLTRVQSELTLSDVFGGPTPHSRKQITKSLEAIGRRGSGVFVYLRRPRAGELSEQIASVSQQSPHRAAMMREYGIGAQILRDLGVRKIELLSSSQRSLAGLQTFGIQILAQHPIPNL